MDKDELYAISLDELEGLSTEQMVAVLIRAKERDDIGYNYRVKIAELYLERMLPPADFIDLILRYGDSARKSFLSDIAYNLIKGLPVEHGINSHI